eukprot:snap_masked-scaffold_18-processed-gene-4.0-mRNA-1 protein AED:1.00 eAED:1.00 QI:0/0/0/0/1/1/3/0/68
MHIYHEEHARSRNERSLYNVIYLKIFLLLNNTEELKIEKAAVSSQKISQSNKPMILCFTEAKGMKKNN